MRRARSISAGGQLYGAKAIVVVVLAVLASVYGCSPVIVNTVRAHIGGYSYIPRPDEDRIRLAQLAQANAKAVAWYKKNEWKFNKKDKEAPPNKCLALSGGGIRSAAFSVGVLRALQEKGHLEDIDVISAVSGGAYAASWYYMQQYRSMTSSADGGREMMRKKELWQKSLDDLVSGASFISSGTLAVSVVTNSLLIPYNLFANGLFGWHANSTPARRMYQDKIQETFLGGTDVDLHDLLRLIKANELPFVVLNTTVRIDQDLSHHNSELAKTVFEFTPLRYGADSFGYVHAGEGKFPLSLAGVVTVSGAAADSSAIPGSSQQVLWSLLNQDLGYFIDNYNTGETIKWRKVLPFPLYFLSPSYHRDKRGTDIYLSDGGHSDNLGVFSLVRRLCKEILIIDAEYDQRYTFEAYFKLKSALRKEMQVDLGVVGIDVIEPQLDWTVEGEAETGRWKEKESGATYDPWDPIVKGRICCFPLENRRRVIEDVVIDIKYVKLSIDERRFKGVNEDSPDSQAYKEAVEYYGSGLVEYYLKSKANKCGQILKCEFPQYTTIDQSYSEAQFRAYVDLGYTIIMKELK